MWNYRVVRKEHRYSEAPDGQERRDYTYSIHEVYYDKRGRIEAVTQDAIAPFGDTVEELRHSWITMAEAFGQGILDYGDIPEPEQEDGGDQAALSQYEVPERRELEEEVAAAPLRSVDNAAYLREAEEERREQERTHHEVFEGTPTLWELLEKIYRDYQVHRERGGQ